MKSVRIRSYSGPYFLGEKTFFRSLFFIYFATLPNKVLIFENIFSNV